MNITVMVKANAKKDEVKQIDDLYHVYTKSPAKDGKANSSVIYLLSKFLNIPQSSIQIKHGFKNKKKIIEVSV